MNMTILETSDTLTLIALEGRLDVPGVNAIETRFSTTVAARHRHTILDLSHVDFIASLGLGMLVAAANALRKTGKALILANPHTNVRSVIQQSRLETFFTLTDSLEEARRQLPNDAEA